MTRLEARRKLAQAAESGGNWRFKGLLLAALPNTGVTKEDMAQAWPSSGNKADYRFLQGNEDREIEMEMNRTLTAAPGTDRHRILSDFATESVPKTLGSPEKPQEIGSRKELAAPMDDTYKRTLFAASTFEEIDTLFREELLETVQDGAERRKIARSAANVMNVDRRRGEIPIGSDETAAERVAQGTEIKDGRKQYATIDWDATKIAKGARITDEMIDHARVDLIEDQAQWLGASVENGINNVWLTKSVDGAQNSVTFDGTVDDPGYQALNEAYGEVDNDDFIPDEFVTHPDYRTELYSDNALRFANRSGSTETVRERVFDPLLDMEHFAASGNSYDSDGDQVQGGGSNTWDFANTSDIGAFVTQSQHNHLVLYSANGEGIEIKDYDDPIRDLVGVNARIHVDQDYTQARSAAVIEQS